MIAALGLSSIANAAIIGPQQGAYVWALDVTAPNAQHNMLIGSLDVTDQHLRRREPIVLHSVPLALNRRRLVAMVEGLDDVALDPMYWRSSSLLSPGKNSVKEDFT
ncbi:hypothetical protein [Caballeronia arationis]|uniref:hypothetical protein n=1 Tax=Caballeronia arationis TaxID=1777142 RepID=UPI000786C025|nr:hypothetical protein [Caballeronia arationis]